MKLSFLDFGYASRGITNSPKVIENLFSMTSQLDQLGCKRFWLGEHYGIHNEVSWFSPRILLPLLLANTESMRIGTGGELLKYHSPLLTAHDYTLMSAIFKGRVDLGVAKGGKLPSHLEQEFYQQEITLPIFLEKIQKTAAFLVDDKEREIQMPLPGTAKPAMWFLGANRESFPSIAKAKGNLSMSLFHKPQLLQDKNILLDYIDIYQEQHGHSPEVAMSTLCYCAHSEKAKTAILQDLKKKYPADVIAEGIMIDTPKNIYTRLREIATHFGIDEIIVHNDATSVKQKNEILELFAYVQEQERTPIIPVHQENIAV